jgi:hypothetical protein
VAAAALPSRRAYVCLAVLVHSIWHSEDCELPHVL